MSRDAHLAAVDHATKAISALRAGILFARDMHYTPAAASCIAAIGLPESAELPGGAVFQALEEINGHLDHASFWAEQALDDLFTYRKGV